MIYEANDRYSYAIIFQTCLNNLTKCSPKEIGLTFFRIFLALLLSVTFWMYCSLYLESPFTTFPGSLASDCFCVYCGNVRAFWMGASSASLLETLNLRRAAPPGRRRRPGCLVALVVDSGVVEGGESAWGDGVVVVVVVVAAVVVAGAEAVAGTLVGSFLLSSIFFLSSAFRPGFALKTSSMEMGRMSSVFATSTPKLHNTSESRSCERYIKVAIYRNSGIVETSCNWL